MSMHRPQASSICILFQNTSKDLTVNVKLVWSLLSVKTHTLEVVLFSHP